MEFTLSKELLEAIANYLASKPYNEVAGLLDVIKQIKPNEVPGEK